MGEINVPCRACPVCERGETKHCPKRTVVGIQNRDGAFAEYIVLPIENLHRVPEGVPTYAALFTEPLAAALEIVESVDVKESDRVLLVGAGKLGQLVAQVLALTGCDLTVVGRHERLLQEVQRFGANTATDASNLPGDFDIAVECTGNSEGFDIARRHLRPRGTLVLKSTYGKPLEFDATPIVVDEIRVVGSRCGPFDRALALLAEGKIDTAYLKDAEYPLADAEAAFEHATRPGTLKVVLETT